MDGEEALCFRLSFRLTFSDRAPGFSLASGRWALSLLGSREEEDLGTGEEVFLLPESMPQMA